jgi:hypothetical protein
MGAFLLANELLVHDFFELDHICGVEGMRFVVSGCEVGLWRGMGV